MVIENSSDDWVTLNMYDQPSVDFPSFSYLATICKDRIDAYKRLDKFREEFRSIDEKKKVEWSRGISNIFTKHSYKFFTSQTDDLLSHWILKLLFNEENKSDLLINEGNIFSARLFVNAEKYASGFKGGKSDEEKEKIKRKHIKQYYLNKLKQYHDFEVVKGINPDKEEEERIKVPFKFCARLLEKYEVKLENGYAIVTPDNVLIVIQDIYSEILHAHNTNVKKLYKQIIKADERFAMLLQLLKEFHKNTDYSYKPQKHQNTAKVDARNIDFHAKEHFPMCMQEIYGGLKKKHQLKHWGRLQLGLFLKGVGMTLNENIALFSTELAKVADGNKKQSEYKYYIEHMYGKKGKKTDYTPWSCNKIAEKAIPSGNDIYGCPFKYYSDANLKNALVLRNLNEAQIEDVISARKDGFNMGCRKVFEYTHNIQKVRNSIGKHPNGYFLSSHYAKSKNKTPQFISNLSI
jgi:DNA primase large subunit